MDSNVISKPRHSGVLLHPTSLPNGDVCGTFGEPSRIWLDLLAKNEISVWQFLPLAPTDETGSPYSSPSSFAFNPWFLDINDLIREGFVDSDVKEQLPRITSKDNSRIDFILANVRSEVIGRCLRKAWIDQGEKRHLEFDNWSSTQSWLEDHACFMEIKRQNNGLPWWKWPEPFATYNIAQINIWKSTNKDNLLEHRLIQWHLERQWNLLRKQANNKGILLFGDLPFYVSRDSSDVWSNQNLFSVLSNGDLLTQSGVPPDYFSETGQLWGTPTFRWQKHQRTNFKWWRSRFKRQWSQVDLLRLDHFRALNSFWSVPGHKGTAQNGHWSRSPGLKLLSMLKKDYGTKLPLVAEDLGVITSGVEMLRDYFNFPGMKILQFAFDGNPSNPYLPENISGYKWIVYTGTHDNPTTVGWWDDITDDMRDRIIARDNNIVNDPSWKLIKMGMQTESVLFVAPVQDILSFGNEARLNTPGTIADNWSWRLSSSDSTLSNVLRDYGDLSRLCGRSFKDVHLSLKP